MHWQPFGDEAYASAAARDAPVFLSIGSVACHWCHAMAHESFEDRDTAVHLHAHCLAVKADREERPDVDAVYMAATHALGGEGSWPMSVFLQPDEPRDDPRACRAHARTGWPQWRTARLV